MFTVDEINLYREEYIKYSNNIIPVIEDVKYDLKGDSNGLIKSSEIINNKIIVHLNPEIFEYHPKFQVGVLWHEFTHIYDELNCTYTSNIKQNYMKSVSEIRATSFECKYLLNMRPYEHILYDTSRKIHFMNYHREFEAILNYYNECSKIEFEKFLKTLLPEDFNSACNSFMY